MVLVSAERLGKRSGAREAVRAFLPSRCGNVLRQLRHASACARSCRLPHECACPRGVGARRSVGPGSQERMEFNEGSFSGGLDLWRRWQFAIIISR